MDSALSAARSSHAKKKVSPQFYRTRGNILMARIRIQQSRLHPKRRVPPMDAPSQLSQRCVRKAASSFQKSRLPHGVTIALSSQKMHLYRRRVFKTVVPPASTELAFSPCFCNSVQQYTGTSRRLSTPGSKYTNDKLKASGRFRLCI